MSSVSDDEVIKRKLLLEGERGGDDVRLNNLLKNFFKWCGSADDDTHATNDSYQKMLLFLAQSEYAMDKNLQVFNMNLKEQEKYEKLNQTIEEKIEEAHEKITECKSELHQAKRVRRNRQEYDALAKVIQQHPDRQNTIQHLEKISKELESMESTKAKLDQKLELRKKQFHVLIAAIHEIQRVLDDEDELDLTEDQDDDITDADVSQASS